MPLFGKRRRRQKYNDIHVPLMRPLDPPPYSMYPSNLAQTAFDPAGAHNSPSGMHFLGPTASNVWFTTMPQHGTGSQLAHDQQRWMSCNSCTANSSCPLVNQTAGYYNRGVELYDAIGDKFSDIISLIDEEAFRGGERELIINLPPTPPQAYALPAAPFQEAERAVVRHEKPKTERRRPSQDKAVNAFSKLDWYLNSRLPATLPPLRVYMPTYPLLCLAAQYSASAYHSPTRSEKKDFVSADGRLGTKAMVIKSVPCDDKKTLVFAIRGTSMLSIRDWGVNLHTEAVSPQGFLDDEGNLCHRGFLKVAKAMMTPIAMRLRALLEENPGRTNCSLLVTGHSAGGAVASLLYAHMLSETVQSELNILTGCFKRVHCVTFGAPPVSLLPLQKPAGAEARLRKCLFHSFMNEGDPVVRAEKAYVKSLIDLLASPPPSIPVTNSSSNAATNNALGTMGMIGASMSKLDLTLKCPAAAAVVKKSNPKPTQKQKSLSPQSLTRKLWWDLPAATLSNAGRLVVLRVPPGSRKESDVTASIVTDEQLRQVVFGDPLMHAMDLYARRIEALAVRAVTARACP